MARSGTFGRLRTRGTALALTAVAAVAVGCSAKTNASKSADSPAGAGPSGPPGTVHVLYAGSLAGIMEHDLGPAFAKASGAKYVGYGAGSAQVAKEISGRTRRGDVFISASPQVNDELEGQHNGDWVRWYVTFARAPLVLGYNPRSRFADDIKHQPWYETITRSGIRVGRTDPKLDPKGKLTAQAFDQAGSAAGDSFATRAARAVAVFPEETLVGRLQSGQLDAGFFYAHEATQAHIPTVPLGRTKLSATFTVTVLNHARNAGAGLAFVEYLLGPQGRKQLADDGLSTVTYRAGGDRDALPAPLKSAVH